ncbi:hypothetical protein BCR42DRAFT_75393 [Absidia repens]|uniref:HTH APSES-type domain-containing protein n=1 Tax=Absidia repens TaxID=90262 RepID=A0A1X2IAD1_9FUNG|nr:hypothetical protein BCR42DRAFT_75393 [Absidia repens]
MEQKIYKATYSGVPVYEISCNGVAVMRRKNDNYMNATQILKVADFDKPQRTRILEREVQIGEHEKIQGGYGKYQGTWVPLEKAANLAAHYNVDTLIKPLLEFVKGDESPPLAPKHSTAATTKIRKPRERRTQKKVKHLDDDASDADDDSGLPNKKDSSPYPQTSSPRRQRRRTTAATPTIDSDMVDYSENDGDLYSKTTRHSRHKRSKISDHQEYMDIDDETHNDTSNGTVSTPKSKQRQSSKPPRALDSSQGTGSTTRTSPNLSPSGSPPSTDRVSPTKHKTKKEVEHERTYAHQLFAHFLSGNDAIPPLLQRPPRDLDVNVIIDDVGHTCLHWAAVMGHIATVEQLIRLKADIYRVNYKGQTALMRSVLYTNNYEQQSFDKLLDLLSGTIFNIDKSDQTVFHHVASTANGKGKVHASRYYMENLINKLAHNRSEIISILNVQDVCGDTALTIVTRIGNKRLARMLIDAGASPEIANEEGMTAQAYLAAQDHHSTDNGDVVSSPSLGTSLDQNEEMTRQQLRQKADLMYKAMISGNSTTAETSTATSTTPSLSNWVDHLAASYERDLTKRDNTIKEKQRDIQQALNHLKETEKSQSLLVADQQEEIQKILDEGDQLALELRRILHYTQQAKLKQWIKEQEEKQHIDAEKPKISSSTDSQIPKPPTPPLTTTSINGNQPPLSSPKTTTTVTDSNNNKNNNGNNEGNDDRMHNNISTQRTLQNQLDQLQQSRQQLMDDIIAHQPGFVKNAFETIND